MPSKIRGGTKDKHLADMHIPRVSALAKPGGSLGLLTNLTAWWEMDEASGNALDSHTNALHLTDTNTVTNAAGVGGVGTARLFTRTNDEYFTRTSETLLQPGNASWSACAWVYLNTALAATRAIFNKDGISGGSREFGLCSESANTLRFRVFDGTNSIGAGVEIALPSTGTWYFLVWYFDKPNNTVNASVNNGAISSAAASGTAGTTTSAFYIGERNGTATTAFDGRMAKIGYWKGAVLKADQITFLYNSGAGRTYAELT